MSPVAIVTDTTHYLPRDLIAEHGIREVSLWVNDGDDRHQRESDMPDYHEFYERLRRSETMPTTSQPSIGDFLEVYEPLVAEGYDIVSIHIAGGISGTVESARQAAAEAGTGQRRIEVIDSRSACAGLGLIALAAAGAARGGADVTAVAARAKQAADVSKIWFAIDTLEFLRRGGRIGSAQAWLGGALKIKPILTVDHEITPIERVRTSARAFERMVAYLQARKEDGATAWAVQHIEAEDHAQELANRGREIFDSEPICVSEIGPVIGTHTGPGLLGVCGIPPALLGY